MSIFNTILRKIFPADHPAFKNPMLNGLVSAAVAATDTATPVRMTQTAATSTPAAASSSAPAAASTSTTAAGPAPMPAAAPQALPPVDVEGILTDMAQKNGQSLNWRTSIVDLLKLLQLDSSLTSRKELAKELNYTGDTNDSATMNIWLHKQVMEKLAQNGGNVPSSLMANAA